MISREREKEKSNTETVKNKGQREKSLKRNEHLLLSILQALLHSKYSYYSRVLYCITLHFYLQAILEIQAKTSFAERGSAPAEEHNSVFSLAWVMLAAHCITRVGVVSEKHCWSDKLTAWASRKKQLGNLISGLSRDAASPLGTPRPPNMRFKLA